MPLKFAFAKAPKPKSDTAIVGVYAGGKLGEAAKTLDTAAKGLIKAAVEASGAFEGKTGQTLSVPLPKGAGFARALAVGLGDPKKTARLEMETLGGNLYPALKGLGTVHATLFVDAAEKGNAVSAEETAASIANGIKLRSYVFDAYKEDKTKFKQVDVVLAKHTAAQKIFKNYEAAAEGVFFARDMMNEPPNVLYPDSFAKRIAKELRPLGVDVEILDEKQMKKKGFHSHYEVGKGSARQPRVVIMRWHGKPAAKGKSARKTFTKPPVAFVGKGVTFDTGGISIKPAGGMEAMKMDMGGSAAVVGVMKALALRKSKAPAVGIVGLAENMPSSSAYRPGDIINSMAGKTIEVLNTDAEGRLVLIDSLTYVQKTYKPKIVIDLATLTGAMMVALGFEYCGAFVNDDKLWAKLEGASKETGEKLWRMPLDEEYRKQMEGKFSDLNNLGNIARYGGACTAAGFLEHFIEKGTVWAHLDIAGKMDQKGDKPTVPSGGVGFGVRVLDQLVADNYEK